MIPALGRWKQEEQKFKTPFGYIACVRPASHETLSQKHKTQQNFLVDIINLETRKKLFHSVANGLEKVLFICSEDNSFSIAACLLTISSPVKRHQLHLSTDALSH